ncbi:hypothetical protein L2E82_28347 [Cichorium intybus]|uniref:Uncharacterized protein n=1 Tax=Cichorium intybus TaxID=13427 RepID=A0ACB9CVS2_CICIN|nr:hypothetical protein L2E82_28347 [Cichorium intybus]
MERISDGGQDPSKAVSMFWDAINSDDRVESALKDMTAAMKHLDRSDEVIEAIKSFRHLCPLRSTRISRQHYTSLVIEEGETRVFVGELVGMVDAVVTGGAEGGFIDGAVNNDF